MRHRFTRRTATYVLCRDHVEKAPAKRGPIYLCRNARDDRRLKPEIQAPRREQQTLAEAIRESGLTLSVWRRQASRGSERSVGAFIRLHSPGRSPATATIIAASPDGVFNANIRRNLRHKFNPLHQRSNSGAPVNHASSPTQGSRDRWLPQCGYRRLVHRHVWTSQREALVFTVSVCTERPGTQ